MSANICILRLKKIPQVFLIKKKNLKGNMGARRHIQFKEQKKKIKKFFTM